MGEGLGDVGQPEVPQDLGEEPRVDEVEDGVLDAADVEVDGQPELGGLGPEGQRRLARRAIPEEVPRRIDEGVHRVRLPAGRAVALRAGRLDEALQPLERRALLAGELDVEGQLDGQVGVGDADDAAACRNR